MLMSLELDELELVSGGQNITTVTNSRGSTTTNQSDYAYCTSAVTQACRTANPGMLWGTNEPKAAQCTIESMPKASGLPPTGQ